MWKLRGLNRVVECICCAQIDCIVAKNNIMKLSRQKDWPNLLFASHSIEAVVVCLNLWVLQTAWYNTIQQYQDSYSWRGGARVFWERKCEWFCHRAHFPPLGFEEDFVFEGFHFQTSIIVLILCRITIEFLFDTTSLLGFSLRL